MDNTVQVVVNADDFGINETQTLEICRAFKMGLLSQTTTMANMPWFEKSSALAKEQGFFHKVGLHFNLTEGLALSEEMRACPFFCDGNGRFTGNFHRSLRTRLLMPKRFEQALRMEAEAQMSRYADAGYTMMHLDSHHHVHTDFSVARVIFPLALKYGFKTCRLSRTITTKPMGILKHAYKVAFNRYVNRNIRADVDEFTDFNDFSVIYNKLQKGCRVEVMVHPGLALDPSLEVQQKFWENLSKKGVKVCHD